MYTLNKKMFRKLYSSFKDNNLKIKKCNPIITKTVVINVVKQVNALTKYQIPLMGIELFV